MLAYTNVSRNCQCTLAPKLIIYTDYFHVQILETAVHLAHET